MAQLNLTWLIIALILLCFSLKTILANHTCIKDHHAKNKPTTGFLPSQNIRSWQRQFVRKHKWLAYWSNTLTASLYLLYNFLKVSILLSIHLLIQTISLYLITLLPTVLKSTSKHIHTRLTHATIYLYNEVPNI